MEDKITFEDIANALSRQYPRRKIEIVSECGSRLVKVDGETRFNATGYNMLYNLKRLVNCLEDELI